MSGLSFRSAGMRSWVEILGRAYHVLLTSLPMLLLRASQVEQGWESPFNDSFLPEL